MHAGLRCGGTAIAGNMRSIHFKLTINFDLFVSTHEPVGL